MNYIYIIALTYLAYRIIKAPVPPRNPEVCKHRWKYNFPNMPSKRICTVCKLRQARDWEKVNLETEFNDQWTLVFKDSRTDEVLIKTWFN
jgi:hypothetical protein